MATSIIVADGTKVEEFAIAVADYIQRQALLKEMEVKVNASKDAIKAYMVTEGINEAEVGEHVVKLIEVTRETVNTKVAKTLIPKKYLDKEGVLTTTTFQQLRVDRQKA